MVTSMLSEAVDLVLPGTCAACGQPTAPVCSTCLDHLVDVALPDGPREVSPSPRLPGLPPVYSWGSYEGVARHLVTAYKDEGRRDTRRVLAVPTAAAMAAACARVPRRRVLVVPLPSSRRARRQRGDDPIADLATLAAALVARRTTVVRMLDVRRAVADQAGLGESARQTNVGGAMRTRRPLAGDAVLLVDDIVTSGATLVEGARVVRAAGAGLVVAATAFVTRRRSRRDPLDVADLFPPGHRGTTVNSWTSTTDRTPGRVGSSAVPGG